MSLKSPIIFIHYGPANYLRWTLECARATNPGRRVIMLGDQANKKYARGHAEFVDFHELAAGEKIAEFDRIFRVIQGERHRFTKHGGVEAWLKFVFRRWFLIEEFLHREGIGAFWTFDSDTLLLVSLGPREARFSGVAATTQCLGACLNGWVGSADLVAGYTKCVLELFRDEKFLDVQRERLRVHVGLAFNEMDAFCEFCRRDGIIARRASQVIEGEAFDDALAFVDDYETSPVAVLGKTAVKRLWTSPQGGIWAKTRGEHVRLLTCNMSWMPDYLWRKILRCALAGHQDDLAAHKNKADRRELNLRELNLREPLGEQLLRRMAAIGWRMKHSLSPHFSPAHPHGY